ELQGALTRVMAVCDLNNSYPDIKTTTNILASTISQPIKKAITPKDILKIVSEFYDVSNNELIMKNRKKEIVKPRQIAMYLMRSEIKSSFPSIGTWIGGRDHTTAMHAFEKISKEMEVDKTIEQEINLLIEKLYT
ncbi:MAG: chromosomal replication initiator protein DnaA, partial [Candidatus Pacebacteria bacterium]|nr:chromosomal replication initiator protein DnaA [Candidatus Paceibacterota bacterium]